MHESDWQIEQGQRLHRAGNLRDAAEVYKNILQQNPDHPEALYLLGCVAHQSGNSSVAVELFDKAIRINPSEAAYYSALGTALATLENYDQAELHLRQAVTLGTRPEFHSNLGMVLRQKNRLAEAIIEFEAAVKLVPRDADAHYNLGKAYQASKRLEEAIRSFDQVLEINRVHIPALAALRQILQSVNRQAEAKARLDKALAPLGQDADGLCDFADSLQDAQDLAGAIAAYHRALVLQPQSSRAWYACGCAELAGQELLPAINCFDEALKLRPDWIEARHNLAKALYFIGQVSLAFKEFKRCAARTEENARHARAMIATIVPGVPEVDHKTVLQERRAWVNDIPASEKALGKAFRFAPAADRLKIGYVSSFFSCENWMKPVWGLINEHRRTDFELHLFSDAPRAAIKHGFRSNEADHFFDTTKLSNGDLADLIETAGIQILVDLNGYSDMKRLSMFLLRPAPVILGWFNMYGTTGMSCFDYLVGDNEVIPVEDEAFYSERILRVTGSYLTFRVDYPVPPVARLPWSKNAQITFGSLGSQYKITTEVIEAWSRILNDSPASHLVLKNKHLRSSTTCEFLRSRFAELGVGQERVHLEGPENHFEFLKTYDRIDIALDTWPYNGGTTTTEAIWQGVPVLTFTGDRWASRTSASILRAGGLNEFVADDLEGFISLSIRLANDSTTKDRLANLRVHMRRRLAASSLCDTAAFARQMESFYRRCWDETQA